MDEVWIDGVMSTLGNHEGDDFIKNYWTHKAVASRGPVLSAYVRFSDEELFEETEYCRGLMAEVDLGLRLANDLIIEHRIRADD